MKYKEKIEQLKKLTLIKNQDFSIPAKYFLYDLFDSEEFINTSKLLTENLDFYKQLLTMAMQKHGKNTKVAELRLMQINEGKFVHGSGFLTDFKVIVMYFFPEIQTGMACIINNDGTTDFFRLTYFTTNKQPIFKSPIKSLIIDTTDQVQ